MRIIPGWPDWESGRHVVLNTDQIQCQCPECQGEKLIVSKKREFAYCFDCGATWKKSSSAQAAAGNVNSILGTAKVLEFPT